MDRRVIQTEVLPEDSRIETSLRPKMLRDYIGQEKAKKNLKNLQNPVVEDEEEVRVKNEKRLQSMKDSTEYYNKTAKPGSIASKARMVEQYNEKSNKNAKSYKK